MKTKLTLSAVFSLVFYLASSQVPQGFNYQAIARDGMGQVIANTTLPVRITIQTLLTGGTTIWEEEHMSVTSNQFGLISLVVGTETKKTGTAATFSAIDWNAQPLYLKTTIRYPGTTWTVMGTTQLWSVPYSMVAKDVEGPITKLGIAGTTTNMEEALFEVKNRIGQTVFAVYNEGVRVYVDDGAAKAAKGGFAVGGFGTGKSESQKYFYVDADSIRAYIYDDPAVKAAKGGFAVGGYNLMKNTTNEYIHVSPDSIRMYIDDTGSKAAKGGFAVGGFGMGKGPSGHFLDVATDANGIINPSENRVLWYPLKNAFLTGKVLIEKPDSVGENSFASGYESKAIGDWSQALGYKAIARGDYSTAIGKYALAGKTSSFAFGDSTKASGDQSYALGKKAVASGFGSFAFGSLGIDSLGNVIGTTTRSLGRYSFAMGLGSLSDHQGSFSIGTNASATGDFALAMGYNTQASAKFSNAFGIGSVASGLRSFAAGSSTASGLGSVALGNSKASGRYSFAMGTFVVKNILDPTLMTHASGDYSAAIGVGTSAHSYCMMALGSYNLTGTASLNSWVERDPIFVVGNGRRTVGTMVERSNALTILKNGNIGIGTSTPTYLLDVSGDVKLSGRLGIGSYTSMPGLDVRDSTRIGNHLFTIYGIEMSYFKKGATASFDLYHDDTFTDYGLRIFRTSGTNSSGGILHKGTGALQFWTMENAPIDLYTSSVRRMTVSSTGSVGIGTSSPWSLLHIKGNASILDLEGSDHCYIRWYPDGVAAGRKGYFGYPDATVNDITLSNEISTGDIILLPGSSGNMGVGFANPQAKVEISVNNGDRFAFYGSADNTLSLQTLLDNVPLSTYGGYGAAGENRLIFQPLVGRVGIGTTAPTHILHINGIGRSTSSTWATSSDMRVKENINTIENSLLKITNLNPVSFKYTQEYVEQNKGYQGTYFGFLAQEVEKVLPEIVTETKETVGGKTIEDFLLLNQGELIPVMVGAIKEQQDQIESLQKQIGELKTILNNYIPDRE